MKARARALVRALPARIALPFLALVGSLEWWLRPGRRAEAMARMRLILRGTAREGEAQPLARRSLRRSRVMLELLWRGDVSERARIEGAERLDALRAEGHGALVVHTHLCWIAPQLYALAAQGHADAIVLTIDDPPTPLQDHWQRVLTGWGVDPVAAEGSYPVVLDHLHRGHLCHIALDVPGSTACVFLDKPARLASGIAALAFASGAPLVPVTPRRPGRGLRVRVGDPIRPQAFATPAALTQHLADVASAAILAAPECYHEHDWLWRLWSPAP